MYIEKKMFVKGDRITHFINIRQLPSVMNHSMTGMNSEEYKRKKKPRKTPMLSRWGFIVSDQGVISLTVFSLKALKHME